MPISRIPNYLELTISAGSWLSDAFDLGQSVNLIVRLPSGSWTDADIGFQESLTKTGEFLPLRDMDGGLVQIAGVAVSGAYVAPTEVMGARWVKLWSQNSGISVAQAATRTLEVELKT